MDALAGKSQIRTSTDADDIAAIHLRNWFKNFATLSKVMSRREIKTLWNDNKAVVKSEQNAVMVAELRQRGLPVHGETAVSLPQKLAPVPAVAPALAQITLPFTQALAVPPANANNAPLTAEQYTRLTAQERSDYGLRNGEMLRSEFQALTPAVRMSFVRSGGRVIDDPSKPAPEPLPEAVAQNSRETMQRSLRDRFAGNGETMSREAFAKLSPHSQMEFCRNGGRLTD